MKKKQYLLMRGWIYLTVVVAVIMIALSKREEIDEFGSVFGIIFILLFSYKWGGFWVATLATPLLGIQSFIVFLKKIKQAKRHNSL